VSFFHSAGIATQTGMGLIPLSWQEIQAFVRCNAHEGYITPWELGVVRRKMSEAYCAEYARASGHSFTKKAAVHSLKSTFENARPRMLSQDEGEERYWRRSREKH
jgi:hypothetical protein